jgi:uncharacterized protein (DUF1778 family)
MRLLHEHDKGSPIFFGEIGSRDSGGGGTVLGHGGQGQHQSAHRARTRQLIDKAAAILGKTRTDFMIDSARSLAIDALLDQRLFVLDSERYDAFIDARDNPVAPGPKLRALLRKIPAWET